MHRIESATADVSKGSDGITLGRLSVALPVGHGFIIHVATGDGARYALREKEGK